MAKEEAEIKELSKKLAQNPDSMVFVQLADAYRRAGELEKSVEICIQGLERHPTYTTARAILGRNYLDLDRLDEASNEFRQIEVADPENIMAHRMLGQIFLQKGQFAEAIVRQQRVLALDPDDSTAQELLQAALTGAKQAEQAPKAAPAATPAAAAPAPEAPPPAPAPKAPDAQSGTLKVAEIYIKKGALDEAAEVLQEILAADPGHSVAQQKLSEVNKLRGIADDNGKKAAEEAARKKAEDEAKAKAAAEEAAKKKAEDEAKAKAAAEEAAKKKAEEEAKAKAAAEEAAKKKAEDEAKAKAAAEEAARKKAEEEAKAKAAAEAAAKKQAEEEAKAKAAAEEAAKKQAEEEAKAKAAAEAAARKKAEEEEAKRKSSKLSSEDILSVMTDSSDELIEDDAAPKAKPDAKPEAKAAAKLDPEIQKILDDFVKAQGMEACLLLDAKGAILDGRHAGRAAEMGSTAAAIFSNTEKAAMRMQFGGLKQIMIVGEDSRQILFVALKAGVMVALTGKQTNLGLLRVAVNDLVKRA